MESSGDKIDLSGNWPGVEDGIQFKDEELPSFSPEESMENNADTGFIFRFPPT